MSRHKFTAAERRKAQQARRQKAREAPKRRKQIERAMDEIEKQRRREADPSRRAELIREIRALGIERAGTFTREVA